MTSDTRTTHDSNYVLFEGDLVVTANHAADALACLACLDFERVGNRYGAANGVFLLLETIVGALNTAAPRDWRAPVNIDALSEKAQQELDSLADSASLNDRASLNDTLETAIQEAFQRAATRASDVAKEGKE